MKLTQSEKRAILIGTIIVVVVAVIMKIALHFTPVITINSN